MPWIPELFSAPVLEQFRHEAEVDALVAAPVPYFAGVRSGETDALVRSFAGEPELHHPIRGRVKGWGRTDLPPQAGLAVYVRGNTGKLASARMYDDADPPLGSER